jgi:hypothetical protein
MTALFQRHFQVAYVVDDIHAATAALRQSQGVSRWDVMDMTALAGPGQALKFIANAWSGDVMIELMQPDPAVASICNGWQQQSGSPLRLHHLGFLVDSAEQMAEHRQHLSENGHSIVADGSFGDELDFAYADTTALLGHYYEIIWLKKRGDNFFSRIPVN